MSKTYTSLLLVLIIILVAASSFRFGKHSGKSEICDKLHILKYVMADDLCEKSLKILEGK